MTVHTLRDPDNRGDDGAPYEFTGDADRIAAYLDMLAERDMRSAEGRAAVTALARAIRAEGTVSPGHAESIRQAAGVYVTAAVPVPPMTREQVAARLRGDIFDAVPDDNDMQHVLSIAADLLTRGTR